MVYIELLAKENLKVKNYLIENPLPRQPPSTLRIHDSRSPFTTKLLLDHDAVCEETESLNDTDRVGSQPTPARIWRLRLSRLQILRPDR
jgi:hypothetical protein